MARDDKSIPHRSPPLSPHIVLVSFPLSFLLLVIHLVLVIYRLVSRLAPVVLLLRLVSLRRRFYPCRYRIRHLLSPSAHLSVHHPIVAVFHCFPYCPIASLRSPPLRPYPYHHRHRPCLMEKSS